ncbi:MAG: hypothetical protein II461_01425, partial [Treponema sp.]|nr:hypothetical protein [Treponema sp.]
AVAFYVNKENPGVSRGAAGAGAIFRNFWLFGGYKKKSGNFSPYFYGFFGFFRVQISEPSANISTCLYREWRLS